MVKTEFSHICLGQESVKRASTETQSCEITNKAWLVPYVISLAVRLAVSDEASARLVQILTALCALQTGCVPLQVRGHPQDVLVMDLTSTADTHGDPRLLWIWKAGISVHRQDPYQPRKTPASCKYIIIHKSSCFMHASLFWMSLDHNMSIPSVLFH